ncbi:unnamed protein product [Clonostachys rosea]|uniref:Zn(2)-C6 fungal-type domain-containing protein n=1 Tax=Bionectria ochroleuca TaxID=29856 RepID=A0ABY6ULP6_BIOOC|nr:unnamed protein product [Clonostachys rosea]
MMLQNNSDPSDINLQSFAASSLDLVNNTSPQALSGHVSLGSATFSNGFPACSSSPVPLLDSTLDRPVYFNTDNLVANTLPQYSDPRNINFQVARSSLNLVNNTTLPVLSGYTPPGLADCGNRFLALPSLPLPLSGSTFASTAHFYAGNLIGSIDGDLMTAPSGTGTTFHNTELDLNEATLPLLSTESILSSMICCSSFDFGDRATETMPTQLLQNTTDFMEAASSNALLQWQAPQPALEGRSMVGKGPQKAVTSTTLMPVVSTSEQALSLASREMITFSHRCQSSSARPKRARSPRREDVTLDSLQIYFYNPQQKKAKRAPYAKKTCLRCQAYNKKCSGIFTCQNCSEVFKRYIETKKKHEETTILLWTACFDSDIREMNIFDFDGAGFDLATQPWYPNRSQFTKILLGHGQLIIERLSIPRLPDAHAPNFDLKSKPGPTEYELKMLYLCLTVVTIVASRTSIWQRLGCIPDPKVDNALRERYESRETHFQEYMKYLRKKLKTKFDDFDRQWPWIARSIHQLADLEPEFQIFPSSHTRNTPASHERARFMFSFGYGTEHGWYARIPWGVFEQWKEAVASGIQVAAQRSHREIHQL